MSALYGKAFALIRARLMRVLLIVILAGLCTYGIHACVSFLPETISPGMRTIITGVLFRMCMLAAMCAMVMIVISKTRMPTGKIIARFFAICVPFIYTGIMFRLTIVGGLFLLIIPGLLMWCLYSLWPFILIDERVSGSRALVRSAAFVSEHRHAYMTRFLACEFLLGTLTLIISVIQGGVHTVLFDVCATILTLLITTVIIAYQTVLYQEVKERYSGNVTPTPRHRMFVICIALFPLFLLSVAAVVFLSTLINAIQHFN